MEKCCICMRDLTDDDKATLYINENDCSRPVCNHCDHQLEKLLFSNKASLLNNAGQYFSIYIQGYPLAPAVRQYLLEELTNIGYYRPTTSQPEQNAYTAQSNVSNYTPSSTVWITGLKVIAWIVFIAIIIGGIALGMAISSTYTSGEEAAVFLICFFVSLVIGFATVAGVMVFLNLAQDVHDIKHMLKKK